MKLSRKRLKAGFWGSVGLIVISFLTIGYQGQIPIQFTDEQLRSNYNGALIIAIPSALVLATGFHYQLKGKEKLPVAHIIFGLLMGVFLLVVAALMYSFSSNWVDRQEVFKGRFTNKTVILQRSAWSGSPRFIKVTPIVPGFRYAIAIDTCNLPDHKWMKSTNSNSSN